MILQKFWGAFVAQLNKVANIFWEADPIAQMRYEYDQAVAQLKEGRVGLEQYRGTDGVLRQLPDAPVRKLVLLPAAGAVRPEHRGSAIETAVGQRLPAGREPPALRRVLWLASGLHCLGR